MATKKITPKKAAAKATAPAATDGKASVNKNQAEPATPFGPDDIISGYRKNIVKWNALIDEKYTTDNHLAIETLIALFTTGKLTATDFLS